MSNKVNIETGSLYIIHKGEKKAFQSLNEAMDYLGKCCGYSCCEKLLRLEDQTTGDKMVLYFEGGALKVKDEKTGVIKTATLT